MSRDGARLGAPQRGDELVEKGGQGFGIVGGQVATTTILNSASLIFDPTTTALGC